MNSLHGQFFACRTEQKMGLDYLSVPISARLASSSPVCCVLLEVEQFWNQRLRD